MIKTMICLLQIDFAIQSYVKLPEGVYIIHIYI